MSYANDLKQVKAIERELKAKAYSPHEGGHKEMSELRGYIAGARRANDKAERESYEDRMHASEHIRRAHMTYAGVYKPLTYVRSSVKDEISKYEKEIKTTMRNLMKK